MFIWKNAKLGILKIWSCSWKLSLQIQIGLKLFYFVQTSATWRLEGKCKMIIYDVWSSTLHYDPGTFPTLFMDLWEYRQMLDYNQSCPILPCPEHYTLYYISSVIISAEWKAVGRYILTNICQHPFLMNLHIDLSNNLMRVSRHYIMKMVRFNCFHWVCV